MTNPPAPAGAGGSGCEDTPILGREASASCVAEGTSPSGGLVEADGVMAPRLPKPIHWENRLNDSTLLVAAVTRRRSGASER